MCSKGSIKLSFNNSITNMLSIATENNLDS